MEPNNDIPAVPQGEDDDDEGDDAEVQPEELGDEGISGEADDDEEDDERRRVKRLEVCVQRLGPLAVSVELTLLRRASKTQSRLR